MTGPAMPEPHRWGGNGAAPLRKTVLGDEDQIHDAYLEHGAEIFRFVHHGLGDHGAAEEVTQETFVKAWRSAERYDPSQASLRTWLFRIARNTMIDHLRANRARPWHGLVFDDQDTENLASIEDRTDAVLERWVVEEAVRRISPQHREVIVETYLRGRPYDEVAAELGVPVGTVRSRVFYALKALRLVLDEMGVTP